MKQFLTEGSTLIVLSKNGKKVIVCGDFTEDQLNEVESLIEDFISTKKEYKNYSKPQVKINGITYKSMAEASRKTGIIFNTIKRRIKIGVQGYEII